MTVLLSAARVRALDERAIREIGIPGVVLMEQAGRGAARMAMEAGWLSGPDDPVLLLAGKGNNGGDALVVARVLLLAGYRRVRVVLLAESEKIAGDARTNLEIFRRLGGEVVEVTDAASWRTAAISLETAVLVVDGLLGTGLNSPVRGLYAEVIRAVNQSCKPVLALDIPSGLHADSGLPLGEAVRAISTATFAFGKPGLYLHPGRGYAGRVEIIDIGIPRSWAEEDEKAVRLLDRDSCRDLLPPPPAAEVHKNSRGHLLSFAGRPGFTGAGLLCAGAGLYSGCGLSTLALPEAAAARIEGCNPALMLRYLPQAEDGSPRALPAAELENLLAGKKAVVVGPGFGLGEGAAELLAQVLASVAVPTVIDADALTLLARDPGIMPADHPPLILTPHPGEMARLMGITPSQVQQQRLEAARGLAGRLGVFLVLKGAGTVVAGPDGRMAINTSGNYLLATAGSGDVLSGIIGGLLARGLRPWNAACLGVFLHGLIADRLRAAGCGLGVTAVEIERELPAALAALMSDGCE